MKGLFSLIGVLMIGSVLWSQPINDEPCQAIPLNVNQTCVTINSDNNGATNSVVSNPSCGGYNGEDVWFVALVPANGSINISTQSGSLNNMSMAVYSAPNCDGPFSEEACEDGGNGMPSGIFTGLTPGSYVFIRVWDYYSTGIFGIGADPLEQGTFSICAQSSNGAISIGGTGNTSSYDCGDTPPAGNTCESATPICTFDGYCGSTSGYTANYWYSGGNGLGGPLNSNGIFCGSIENNSFISFVAGSSTVELDVEVSGSVVNCDDGVQFMMFGLNIPGEVCNSNSIVDYGCESPMPPGNNSFTGNGLVPGQTYYLMVDGFAGDICDYQINAISGVLVEMSAGPDQTICLGESADLTIYGAGTGTINWQGQFLNSTVGETVTATPNAVGTYEYIVNAPTISPLCTGQSTDADTVLITVIDSTPISISAGPCVSGETVLTASGGNNYTWSPVESLDQTSGSPVVASPLTQTTYTVTGTGAGGCALSTTVTVDPCDIPCDTPSVSYPLTVCQGSSVIPVVDLLGGVFSFTSLPGDGASIDPNTGEIINPTDGTIYNVTYAYVNLCGTTVEVFSTVTGAPFCGVVLCYDGTNIQASGGDGNYTWYETITTTSTIAITSEAECISCPDASPNYFFGLYTGCSQTTCNTTSTALTQYTTGVIAVPPTSFPLQVSDGSGAVVIYNSLSDIPPCSNPCSPPNLIVDNQAICEPNMVDLNASLNGASDPGNISFYNSITDANTASNAINSDVLSSGVYYLRLEDLASSTCFSVQAVEVTIHPSYSLVEDASVCENTTFTYPDGTSETIISSTSHTSNLSTNEGCDSIIVTNVTVIPEVNLTVNETVCVGANYTFPDGTVSSNITANESHISNLTNVNGCDSVITTNLAVSNQFSSTENVTVCEGSDYTYPDGTVSTNILTDETHISTFISTLGCDSLVTTILTLTPLYNVIEVITACENSTVTFPDGTTQLIASDYTHTSNLTSLSGCDSIIVSNVMMVPNSSVTVDLSVCSGANYTYPDGSVSINITTDESQQSNLTSVNGCDSIVITNITIASQFNSTENVTICEGADYTFPDGTFVTNVVANQSHLSAFISVLGCDSIVTTNLTVEALYNLSEAVTICENSTYTFPDGMTQLIVADMTHISILFSTSGCDSIITTNVTVQPIYNGVENISVCENEVITYPDGLTELITANTTHISSLNSFAGCDSLITTNVFVYPSHTFTESYAVCSGGYFTYPDGTVSNNILIDETHTSFLSTINGCDSIIVTNLVVNEAPIIDAGFDQVICEGESAVLNASGGADYVWNNGVVDGFAFNPFATTTYSVIGTDVNGCSGSDDVTITVEPNPQAEFIGDILIGCEGHAVNFTDFSVGGINCLWDFGDGTTSGYCGDQTHIYNNAGTYTVSLTVSSANNCQSEVVYTDLIEIYHNPIAAFSMNKGQIDSEDMEVDFTNQSIDADSYEWVWNDGTPNSFDQDPTHQFNENGSGGYSVILYAYNNLCVDSAQQFIPFNDVLIFYVPNVFTPDGDEYNEHFQPVFTAGYDPYDFHLSIFNRWGELIFESYDASKGWNGEYGDGGLVQDGVYVWKINFKESMTDKMHEAIGHVSVLK